MKKLETGKTYHEQIDYIGSSLLKLIAQSTLLHAIKKERKDSKAFELGSAIHCAVLETEKFSNEYVISQKFDRRTKEGKQNAEAFELANVGKIILDEDQKEIINGVVKSISEHEIASGMLSDGEAEYSYYSIDPETQVKIKCRPDYCTKGVLVDLKTCQDASVEGFTKACINFGYAIQAAFYLDVFNFANQTNLKEFYFVAVETSAPFAVNTFLMGEVEIELGREQYKKALKQYAEYLKSPENLKLFGYEQKINEIVFPQWAIDKAGA